MKKKKKKGMKDGLEDRGKAIEVARHNEKDREHEGTWTSLIS